MDKGLAHAQGEYTNNNFDKTPKRLEATKMYTGQLEYAPMPGTIEIINPIIHVV